MGHCQYCRWISFGSNGSSLVGTFCDFATRTLQPIHAALRVVGAGREEALFRRIVERDSIILVNERFKNEHCRYCH